MKKTICAFVGLISIASTCFASIPPCFNYYESVVASRLVRVPNYVDGCLYYDEEAMVKHNKFSPFGDRIIDVWLYQCPNESYHNSDNIDNIFDKYHFKHSPWRGFISLNIDKRTITFPLSTAKKKTYHIQPNHRWERYLKYFESVY